MPARPGGDADEEDVRPGQACEVGRRLKAPRGAGGGDAAAVLVFGVAHAAVAFFDFGGVNVKAGDPKPFSTKAKASGRFT